MICSEIPAGEGLLRLLDSEEKAPGLAVYRHPYVAAQRRGHFHEAHHVIGHIGLQAAVVLKGGVQGEFVEAVVISAVPETVEFQLQAVAPESIFLRQVQRIVALGAQADMAEGLAVDDHVAGHVFLFRGAAQEGAPAVGLDVDGVDAAAVEKPAFISRHGACPGRDRLRAGKKQYDKQCEQACRAYQDFVVLPAFSHLFFCLMKGWMDRRLPDGGPASPFCCRV